MHVESHRWHSPRLGQEMGLRLYGHAGKPVLAFPCQGGTHQEFEGFGMVELLRDRIDGGRIRVVTIDSVDGQSWAAEGVHPADRARRHDAYDQYVRHEVVPLVRAIAGEQGILAHGASMGGYHAANVYFRHPDVFDAAICLSGLMQLDHFIGDYMDGTVYLHTPLAYLRGLDDPWYLERLRRNRLVVCCGQGAWEELMVRDALALREVLAARGLPGWVDLWGHDVNHDWPWWRKMLPYHLDKMGL